MTDDSGGAVGSTDIGSGTAGRGVEPTDDDAGGRVTLSVVVITENEEDMVRDCVESAFEVCQNVGSFEVVLVDSASTDRTVELATEYPITVLRIPEEHTFSCGAGRYVGDHFASGEVVLHVDGDMVLNERWLVRAIEHLEDPEVAGVGGCLDESTQAGIADVGKIGGVMLYDADALREIGGFDPHLLGYEDIDVGFRLTHAGYRLLRLPEVSANHHDEGSVGEPLRRWRQGYLIAPGQTIRKWLGSPAILWRLLRRQRFKLALLAWLVVGAASVFSTPLFVGWVVCTLAGFGVAASKLGVTGALSFFGTKAFGIVGLAIGVGRPSPPADAYPVDAVEVIQRGPVHEGRVEFETDTERLPPSR